MERGYYKTIAKIVKHYEKHYKINVDKHGEYMYNLTMCETKAIAFDRSLIC